VDICSREQDGIVIMDISGHLATTALQMSVEVKQRLEAGQNRIILNLGGATYVDSVWLGAIVSTFTALYRAGGTLKLLNVPKNIMQTLVLTRLASVFDIFTDEEDAVNSFFPSRPLRYPRALRDESADQQPGNGSDALRVFLCHSSKDKLAVRNVHKQLLLTQIQPWFDEVDLLPGQLWEQEIPAAVRRSDAILVFLSAGAIGRSGYLQREIRYALDAAAEQSDESQFLIPARLEECEVPERLRKWQWVDLFAENGFSRLLTSLQARALASKRRPLGAIGLGA
jgi:anti-anti-sigma factor